VKRCTLDGATLPDAAAVYRALAEAFDFPDYFGNNPDALWDALTEYSGDPVEIVWQQTRLSKSRLGREFDRIVTVLRQAAAEGRLMLRLD
jgi:ribonuclease inhibitor